MSKTPGFLKNKPAEFAIVGGNLTGLIIGYFLAQRDREVIIIDAKTETGGSLRPFNLQDQSFEALLPWITDTKEHRSNLDWLGDLLMAELYTGDEESSLWTFHSGNFKQFMGFGDSKFKSIDLLSRFNQRKILKLNKTPGDWLRKLTDNPNIHFVTACEVTGADWNDNQVESLTLNGARTFFADQFIFCLDPKKILEIFDNQKLPARLVSKLSKVHPWCELNMYFAHPSSFDYKAGLHFLYSQKAEYEPVLGNFKQVGVGENTSVQSHWRCLVSSDLSSDMEELGQAIKHMKRQIKRAYPDFFDTLQSERILVNSESQGHIDLTDKKGNILKPAPNIELALPLSSPLIPPMQHVDAARFCCERLVADKAPKNLKSTSGSPQPEASL